MTTFDFFCAPLNPWISHSHIVNADSISITDICFLRHQKTLQPDILYIGTFDELSSTQNPGDIPANVFITYKDTLPSTSALTQLNCNIVCCQLDSIDIFLHLSRQLKEYQEQQKQSISSAQFFNLMRDMITHQVTEPSEIYQRFSHLPIAIDPFCSILVICFENLSLEIPSCFHTEIANLFPNCNQTEYDHQIILLISRKHRMGQPFSDINYDALNDLLRTYDAFAAISNATRQLEMLGTCYTLAIRTLQLARELRPLASQRIFHFEEYAEYFMIDLCRESFTSLLGHSDLIYLSHPDAIKLARYDCENHTNLLDVLYHYCLNGNNIVKTAKSAYMHRNTVTAKIEKIHQLISSDLNDGQIRQRMIFSYKILRYFEKYVGITIEEKIYKTKPYDLV